MGLMKSLKGLTGGISESLGFKGHDKIGNTVGQWMNNVSGASDMYNKEYAGNLYLWNLQNEYNTPAAQIARLAAAGIDVNPMTYAVGNGSMSSMASSPSSASVGAGGTGALGAVMSILSGIQGIKNMKANVRLTDQQVYKTANERENLTTIGSALVAQKNTAEWEEKMAKIRYDMMKVAYPAYERMMRHRSEDYYNFWNNVSEATRAILPLSSMANNIGDFMK